jgi:hypothetical protein
MDTAVWNSLKHRNAQPSSIRYRKEKITMPEPVMCRDETMQASLFSPETSRDDNCRNTEGSVSFHNVDAELRPFAYHIHGREANSTDWSIQRARMPKAKSNQKRNC